VNEYILNGSDKEEYILDEMAEHHEKSMRRALKNLVCSSLSS
jgi:hypothetical protein